MICKKCGNYVNDNTTFCPHCGNNVANLPNSSAPVNNNFGSNPQPANKKISSTAIVIIAAAVLILGVIGYALIKNGSRQPKDLAVNGQTESYTDSSTDSSTAGSTDSSTDNNTASTDSDAEKTLISILESAEEVVNKSSEDTQAIENAEYSDFSLKYSELATIMADAASELERLQGEASAIQGIDPRLKEASNHYFETLIPSRKAKNEIYVFFSDYFTINYAFPDPANYDSTPDFYEDMASWYKENKEKVEAVSVPQSVEAEWEHYKNLFETVDDIVDKLKLAMDYDDYLRFYSAINLSERYITAEENAWNSLTEANKAEADFANRQASVAKALKEEIIAYYEMDSSQRADYQFQYDKDTKITLNFDAVDTIYPALFNTYDAFVIFKTGCISGNRDIVVEAEIPGFTQAYKQSFKLDSSYQAIYIKPPALTGELDLSTAKSAQINVSVYEKDGITLISTQSFPVTIKSINDVEWYSDEFGVSTRDNILCFLTPDADEIDLLKRNAITEIYNITGGTIDSMAGYQMTGYTAYDTTYIQAAGIMRALFDMGVRYDASSFSISGSNQRVKLPAEVVNKQSGLCIETALTVASALQSANMHAFLVMPPGHAQVAVEVWNDGDDGPGEYFLIETTALTSDSNNDDIYRDYANWLLTDRSDDAPYSPIKYMDANEWAKYLQDCYVIDCDDSRLLGFTEFAN